MGVACLNAQSGASEQGDDLEHTGHTSFSHSQRQPAHLTSASAQAWGTSSASSPRMQLRPSTRGCMQKQTSGPAQGLIGWPQEKCLLISIVDGRILPMAGNGYLSRHFVIFLPFRRLVKPKCWILKSFSPSYFTGVTAIGSL